MSVESLSAWAELRRRLVRAESSLDDLCNKAAALHNTSEYSRLDGKREGVRLAMSYMDEMVR